MCIIAVCMKMHFITIRYTGNEIKKYKQLKNMDTESGCAPYYYINQLYIIYMNEQLSRILHHTYHNLNYNAYNYNKLYFNCIDYCFFT